MFGLARVGHTREISTTTCRHGSQRSNRYGVRGKKRPTHARCTTGVALAGASNDVVAGCLDSTGIGTRQAALITVRQSIKALFDLENTRCGTPSPSMVHAVRWRKQYRKFWQRLTTMSWVRSHREKPGLRTMDRRQDRTAGDTLSSGHSMYERGERQFQGRPEDGCGGEQGTGTRTAPKRQRQHLRLAERVALAIQRI